MKSRQVITEQDLLKYNANMQRIKLSRDGVKEHTGAGAGGGGAVAERRASGTAVKSSARTSHATSGYKSKLEARYAAHLEILVKTGEIRRWEYEPMSLKLAEGKRYRPDFLVVLPLGAEAKAELHEVKGKWTKNRRDGMTHLKWAAQRYGDVFTFRLIEWTGSGFSGSYVVV